MALPARLQEIVEEFADLPAELRLEALLDYSRRGPPGPRPRPQGGRLAQGPAGAAAGDRRGVRRPPGRAAPGGAARLLAAGAAAARAPGRAPRPDGAGAGRPDAGLHSHR